MARLFDGINEYLNNAVGAPVTAAPYTLSAWFWSDENANSSGAIICLQKSTSSIDYIALDAIYRVAGNETLLFVSRSAAGAPEAVATTFWTSSTWHHACGVCRAANDRSVFLDGGGEGVNAVASVPVGLNSVDIARYGDYSPGKHLKGAVAEAGIWNVDLTDDEVAALAAGYSPLAVRPESLVAYWPLGGLYDANDGDHDSVGGYNMTAVNAPTTMDSPPIIYPISPIAVPWLIAVGNPWYAYAQQ